MQNDQVPKKIINSSRFGIRPRGCSKTKEVQVIFKTKKKTWDITEQFHAPDTVSHTTYPYKM